MRVTVFLHSCDDAYDWAEVRGRVVGTTAGEEAVAHLQALSHKYTGADYQQPIGPEGRVILKIAPSRVNTGRSQMAGAAGR